MTNKKWLSKVIGLLTIAALSSCDWVPKASDKGTTENQVPTGTVYESMHNGWIWRVDEDRGRMMRSSWNFGPEDDDVSLRYELTTCDPSFPESICVGGWPVPLTFQGTKFNFSNQQQDPKFLKLNNIFFKNGSADCVRLKSQWETPETHGEKGLWLSYAVFCNGQGYTTLSLVKVTTKEGNMVQSSTESDNLVLTQGRGLRSECRFEPPKGTSQTPKGLIKFTC